MRFLFFLHMNDMIQSNFGKLFWSTDCNLLVIYLVAFLWIFERKMFLFIKNTRSNRNSGFQFSFQDIHIAFRKLWRIRHDLKVILDNLTSNVYHINFRYYSRWQFAIQILRSCNQFFCGGSCVYWIKHAQESANLETRRKRDPLNNAVHWAQKGIFAFLSYRKM